MSREIPEEAVRARKKWRYRGRERPEFAEEPASGQESVWDYPRPPRVESDDRVVEVLAGEVLLARTREAVRVLETASPPTFYLPPNDVRMDYLQPGADGSFCEWKGAAHYWTVCFDDHRFENAAWSYPDPLPGFEAIAGFLSFYPARLRCIVGGEQAHPQPGGFYGGWVTSELVGPFKGTPGTEWW